MIRVAGFFTSSIRRRILTSFAIVILLVIAMTIAGYYQLQQVGLSAEDMIPESLQMGFLQDFGLAAASLDANLERYFVIGGEQYEEAILQDVDTMTVVLESFRELAVAETEAGAGEFDALEELEQGMAALTPNVFALTEAASAELNSKEVNQRILSVYSEIDGLKQAHQTLSAVTLVELQDSALEQERIAVRVIVQFTVLVSLVVLVAVLSSLFVTRSIATPLADLAETSTQIAAGNLELSVKEDREDEIGELAHAFNSMTTQLRSTIGTLEQRVAERTTELEQRSAYMEATAEVARDAASILEVEQLLDRTVGLVSERFGFYHTGIFFLNPDGQWAVLQAASSEGGQRMLARSHRLQTGEGIVGSVAQQGEPRVALDVGVDAAFFDNPDLPATRSEMALPLRARGEVIGVLDVQSQEPEAFSDEDVAALQTLADQVAVAISNARLFRRAQESLEAERRAFGQLSQDAWQEILRTRPDLGFRSDERGLTVASDAWRPEMEQALQTGDMVRMAPRQAWEVSMDGEQDADGDGRRVLAVPIKTRGRVVGVLDTYKPAEAEDWTKDEVALLEAIADQLGEALESARLYEETQKRAAREQAIRQVTERTRRTVDVEAILQNAVAELAKTMGAPRAYVRLGTDEDLRPNAAD